MQVFSTWNPRVYLQYKLAPQGNPFSSLPVHFTLLYHNKMTTLGDLMKQARFQGLTLNGITLSNLDGKGLGIVAANDLDVRSSRCVLLQLPCKG